MSECCCLALAQLVALKRHKDANGKDAAYRENQPVVWNEAFEAHDDCHRTVVGSKDSLGSKNAPQRKQAEG